MKLFKEQEDAERALELLERIAVAAEALVAAIPKPKEKAPPRKAGEFEAMCQLFIEAWNEMAEANGLACIRVLNESDRKNLRNRIKDHKKQDKTLDDQGAMQTLLQVMGTIPQQAFAVGKVEGSRGKWKITARAFLQSEKYSKVAHNEYADDTADRTTNNNGRVRSGAFLTGRGKKKTAKVGTTRN